MKQLIYFRTTIVPFLTLLVWFTFSATVQAVSPPPDGGYDGYNTAEGQSALFGLTTGTWNTAIGAFSLDSNTTGSANTGIGLNAIQSNTTGLYNTAVGTSALYLSNSNFNTAVGTFALYYNTTGVSNTATGLQALVLNATGSNNTAVGVNSLDGNMTGSDNTAVGLNALFSSTGSANTAIGSGAGHNITSGGNVCIGQGVVGVAGATNTTWIRNVYSSLASGRAVYVNSDNKLGTLVSSRRYKDKIKPMGKTSEAILALKPVTFRYKQEIDPAPIPQFGLIAEEVAEENPDLVTRDTDGKPETVRYEAVNAMLLNEFLKEHHTVQELKSMAAKQEETISQLRATVSQQQKGMEVLVASLKEQAAQIMKVSAQVEVTKPVRQMLLSHQ
jgi:hypothetical protein